MMVIKNIYIFSPRILIQYADISPIIFGISFAIIPLPLVLVLINVLIFERSRNCQNVSQFISNGPCYILFYAPHDYKFGNPLPPIVSRWI